MQRFCNSVKDQRRSLPEKKIKALQAAQLDPAQIEQQRAAAITGAVDPIQAQIEKLRGEIPQQIDVEALRKQITEEVLAGMPQPVTNVQAPAVSVGPGAGGMDPYGQGGGYSTLPTTEGAAEMMGARPDYSAALNMSDGMADAMGFIPGGSLEDQIAFAAVQPTTTVPSVAGASPDLNLDLARPGGTGLGVAVGQTRQCSDSKTGGSFTSEKTSDGFLTIGIQQKKDQIMSSPIPDNVANPAIYRKAKAKMKRKFKVTPSAYSSGYLVQEYKRMGGKYKGAKKAGGGEVAFDAKKSDLNKDGKISIKTREEGTAIAKSMAKNMNRGRLCIYPSSWLWCHHA